MMNKLHEVLFILGASLPIILDAKPQNEREEKLKKWILEAIECVVYKNKPMPPTPD